MTGIRERMAHAARCSNLGSSDHSMRPVDCLGAMGSASRRELAGVLAVRLKYANDASVCEQLYGHLRKIIPKPLPFKITQAISEQAIREYVLTGCVECKGTGYVRHVVCMKCYGTAIRRYSDNDRMKEMGVDLRSAKTALYSRLVADLIGILCDEERRAAADTDSSLKKLEGSLF